MAAVQQKSVLAKYGQKIKEAVNKAIENPVDYGFQGGLPPGILDGKAQLTECGFFVVDQGKQNAGEAYYREAGVMVYPEAHIDPRLPAGSNLVTVRGRQTIGIVMCCETKKQDGTVQKTFQENWDDICNRLRMLGGPDCIPEGAGPEEIEKIAADIKNASPPIYFKVSTSLGKVQLDTVGPNKGKPRIDPKTGKPFEPRVWENWHGTEGLENWTPPSPSGAVEEEVASSPPESNGQVSDVDAPEEVASEPVVDSTPDGELDLDALAIAANGDPDNGVAGDPDAINKLKELGAACGYDVEDVDADGNPNDPPQDPFVAAADWTEAVALIRSGGPAAAQVAAETIPEPTPTPPTKPATKSAAAGTPQKTPAKVATATTPAPTPAPYKKGDKVKYRTRGADGKPAKNPKTKQPVVATEHEVVGVDVAKKTVGLKDPTGKLLLGADKKVLAVAWADLEK